MNRLRELRVASGYSQIEVAHILGVNQTAVSQWERGATTPKKDKLLQLCNLYNTNTDVLLGISEMSSDNEIVFSISKSAPETIQSNCRVVLEIFSRLSENGQNEMLKRMKEYAIIDQQTPKAMISKKNSRSEDDSETTIHIAGRDGTRITKTISAHLRDEIRNLPSEDFDV